MATGRASSWGETASRSRRPPCSSPASRPSASSRRCRHERSPSRAASRVSSRRRRNRSCGCSSTCSRRPIRRSARTATGCPFASSSPGAESRALAQLSGAPLVRAKLKQVFGLIHSERGAYTPARQALEEALAEQRRLVGPDHPDALESLHALGRVLYGADDESRARSLLQESLDRHRRVYGDEHEKTARAMFALAPLAGGLGSRRSRNAALAGARDPTTRVATEPSGPGHELRQPCRIPQAARRHGASAGVVSAGVCRLPEPQ